MGGIGLTFLGILLFLTSLFMILLILVQRGKGGGLTGALGGMGGQSAFGSKAGDVFTRITVITAIIWITLCMVTIAAYNPPPPGSSAAGKGSAITGTDADEDGDSGAASGMSGGDAETGGDAGADEEGGAAPGASGENESQSEGGTGEESVEDVPDDLDAQLNALLDDGEADDAGPGLEEAPAGESGESAVEEDNAGEDDGQ